MKQKLGLACALVRIAGAAAAGRAHGGCGPAIARRELWAIVAGLRDRGVTVLVSSTPIWTRRTRCDEVVLLDAGGVMLAAGRTGRAGGGRLDGRCFAVRAPPRLDRRALQQRLLAAPDVTDARAGGRGRAGAAGRAAPRRRSWKGSTWQDTAPRVRRRVRGPTAGAQAAPHAGRASHRHAAAADGGVLHAAGLNRCFGRFHRGQTT